MNNKGFTVIELMIVVAIIGMLASLAVDQYNQKDTHQKTDQIIEYKGK